MKINVQTINQQNVENKKIKESYDKYEELFAKKMLEEQYKEVQLTTGTGSSIMKSMYIDSLSQQLGGKMGISDLLYEQYLRGQK